MLGGGRYDGLIESLGGPHTPAVGWAAGIERLAMLVGDAGGAAEAKTEVIVVVEDDAALSAGMAHLARLRRAGVSAELIASGSPRKRFDKAVKLGAQAIYALTIRDGQVHTRVKGDDDQAVARALLGETADAR